MFQMTLLIYWVIVVLQFQNQLLNEIAIAVQQYYNTHIHTCTTRCPEGTHVGYMNPTWHTWYFRSFDCCTLKPHQFPTRLQLFYFIASYNKSPLIFTTPVFLTSKFLNDIIDSKVCHVIIFLFPGYSNILDELETFWTEMAS